MIFYNDRVPVFQRARILEEALLHTSFTLDDIEVILDSELDTSQVLEYITTVRRNRMN